MNRRSFITAAWVIGGGFCLPQAAFALRPQLYPVLFGGTLPPAPSGYVYVTDTDGAYVIDTDGAYIVEAA